MAVAMIGPKFYAWDRNGKPLAFGKLYTYQARTNTPKDTYQSEDQVVPNSNPVVLNGEGYANIYLDGSYKMVLKDKDENEIWSSDPVTSSQAEEWVNCQAASYVGPQNFSMAGNLTDKYTVGRSVRLSDGVVYYYGTITGSSYVSDVTNVTIAGVAVPVSLVGACASLVGGEASLNSQGLGDYTNYQAATNQDMFDGKTIGWETGDPVIAHEIGQIWSVNGNGKWKVISLPVSDITDFENVGVPSRSDTSNNDTAGRNSFEQNTTGYNNTSLGYRTLQANTEGFDNCVVGVQAMKDNTTGNRNTAIGVDALAKNTTGDHNLALGQNALGFNTTGTYNTALGIDALEFGLNNNFNTAIGQYAGLNLDNSNNNTVIGYNTYQAATSGNGNVSLGFDTLRDQNGVNGNTAIGTEALRGNTSGTFLTAVGYRALRSNTTGTHNIAMGDQAAFKTLDGTHNMAYGFTALYNNISGDYNVAIGDNALFNTTDNDNIGIGAFAGYNLTTGTDNTFIGRSAGFSGTQKVDAVNTTAIGNGAHTIEDNSVQIGNASVAKMAIGQNKMHWLAALPTTGVWARGSIVWNLAVVAGGSPGWICVTAGDFAGTPPVFKAMANVAA